MRDYYAIRIGHGRKRRKYRIKRIWVVVPLAILLALVFAWIIDSMGTNKIHGKHTFMGQLVRDHHYG